MCRTFFHTWPTCNHVEFAFGLSETCDHGLQQIEYVRQHVLAGLGVPQNTIDCPIRACINLGQPPRPCRTCVAAQTITVDVVEARLRHVSAPSIGQPVQQASTTQSVETRLHTVNEPNISQSVQHAPTTQPVEARLHTVSEPSNGQAAPRTPTRQEAQAEIYLRQERAFALLDDEYDRIMADLRLREEQARRIQEAEESSRRLPAGISNQLHQLNGLTLNLRTAEIGPVIHGAGRVVVDRRSRAQRYRDEARERRNHPSGLSQMVIADEEEEEEVADVRNGDHI